MTSYRELIAQLRPHEQELMPWELAERLAANPQLLIIDVREPAEFAAMHIPGALNIPRGLLEAAAEWGYEETEPELVRARERELVVVCRSGNRSLLAAHTLRQLGFHHVASLRSGVRGWKDDDQPLVDGAGEAVDLDFADHFFTPRLRAEQLGQMG